MSELVAHLEAQDAVLGSILIDSRCLPVVLKHVGAEDFTGPRQVLFAAIQQMFLMAGDVRHIDPVTVLDRIDADSRDDLRGYIAQLVEITPTAANAERYAMIVREHATAAQVRELARRLLELPETDIHAMRQLLNRAAAAAMDRRNARTSTMTDCLTGFANRLDDGREWLQWPFPKLRGHMFSRLGDYIVIGAESSVGKTALALQLATFWASKGKKVGFFSLETDRDDITDRMMAGFLGVDMKRILKGQLDGTEQENSILISAQAASLPMSVVDAAGMTAADIVAETLVNDFDIILVDYLQLIVPEAGGNREQEVAKISRALKVFGRSSGVAVVVLSQLNRDSTEDHPTVDRLRDSGQIRQDADLILLLSLENKKALAGPRRIQIAKNKRGTLCFTTLNFDGPRQLFFDETQNGPVPLFRLNRPEQMAMGI